MNLARAVLAYGSGRAVSIAASLATLPLVARALGGPGFGAYSLVISVLTLLGLGELGIGSALLTVIGPARVGRPRDATLEVLASAYWLVSASCAGVGLLFAGFWVLAGSALGRSFADLRLTLITTTLVWLFTFPLQMLPRLLIALERATTAAFWQTAAGIASGVASAAAAVTTHSITATLVAWLVSASIVSLVCGIRELPVARLGMPEFKQVRKEHVRALVRPAGPLWVLSILSIVAYQTDQIVLGSTVGLAAVASYAVVSKVVVVAQSVAQSGGQALWPVAGRLKAEGKLSELRSVVLRAYAVSLVVGILGGFALVVGAPVLRAWIGHDIKISSLLVISFAAWMPVTFLSQVVSMTLNGLSVFRPQVTFSTVMAVTNLALSVVLARRLGAPGPVIASVVTQLAIVLAPTSIVLFRTLSIARPQP